MLLIYSNPAGWDAMPEADVERLIRDHAAFRRGLEESGELVYSDGLVDPVNARTVRVRAGVPDVTDGPFVETKEQLGGFDVIECDSLDEAIALAARHPVARVGSIEVRPFWED